MDKVEFRRLSRLQSHEQALFFRVALKVLSHEELLQKQILGQLEFLPRSNKEGCFRQWKQPSLPISTAHEEVSAKEKCHESDFT
jgi:hypothetical protein